MCCLKTCSKTGFSLGKKLEMEHMENNQYFLHGVLSNENVQIFKLVYVIYIFFNSRSFC